MKYWKRETSFSNTVHTNCCSGLLSWQDLHSAAFLPSSGVNFMSQSKQQSVLLSKCQTVFRCQHLRNLWARCDVEPWLQAEVHTRSSNSVCVANKVDGGSCSVLSLPPTCDLTQQGNLIWSYFATHLEAPDRQIAPDHQSTRESWVVTVSLLCGCHIKQEVTGLAEICFW